jgi:hypothetical protein
MGHIFASLPPGKPLDTLEPIEQLKGLKEIHRVIRELVGLEPLSDREPRGKKGEEHRQRVLRAAVEQIAKHRHASPQFLDAYLLPAIFAAGADELESSDDLIWVSDQIAKQHKHPFWAFNKPPMRLEPEDRLEFLRQMRISGRNIQRVVNACDFYVKDWKKTIVGQSTTAALKPRDIIEEVSRRPPFQRDDAIRHYDGFAVDWELCLISAPAGTKPMVNALFRDPTKGRSAFVQCAVNADENPDIKIAHENDVLQVRGKVDGLFGVDVVNLRDVSVRRTGRQIP